MAADSVKKVSTNSPMHLPAIHPHQLPTIQPLGRLSPSPVPLPASPPVRGTLSSSPLQLQTDTAELTRLIQQHSYKWAALRPAFAGRTKLAALETRVVTALLQMGCSASRFSPEKDDIKGMGPRCTELCAKLDLSPRDVNRLYAAFIKTDLNHDHNVDVQEMVVRNKIECETLARMLMRLQDADGSGKCLFQSFIIVLWAICSSNDASLPALILALFDVDQLGELDRTEIVFLAQLFSNFAHRPNTQVSIKYLENNFTRAVKLEEYTSLVHQTRELFSMSMEMQRMLQDRTLGLYRLRELGNLRAKKWPGKHSFDILEKTLGTTKQEVAQMKMRALGREVPEVVFKNDRMPAPLREKIVRSRAAAKNERDAIVLEREVRLRQEAEKLQREKDKSVREEKAKAEASAREQGKRDKITKQDGKVEDSYGVWFNSNALQHQKGIEALTFLVLQCIGLNHTPYESSTLPSLSLFPGRCLSALAFSFPPFFLNPTLSAL